MKELYSNIVTDLSLNELKEFAKWCNEKLGNFPIIVGGWAVYCYTKGLGSKDIDVVFLGDRIKHSTLLNYFLSHGFIEQKKGLFEREFVKKINLQNFEIEVIVDAVSSNRIITFEHNNAKIPWNWAIKYNKKHQLENVTIYIPIIELLLVYKLGAVFGRNQLMKTGIDFNYYRSKLWKDVYDVLSLTNLKIDFKKVEKFLKKSNLNQFKKQIMQIIADNFDEEIKTLLPKTTLTKIEKILQ